MFNSFLKLKIFSGIDKDIVKEIVSNCSSKSYSLGREIITEGDLSNGEGYIIKSGKVSVTISGNHISELSPGDIFGEIALLNEENRTATVTSLSDIELIIVSFDDLMDMINGGSYKINKEIIRRIEENIENS